MRVVSKNCPACKGYITFPILDRYVQCPHCAAMLQNMKGGLQPV